MNREEIIKWGKGLLNSIDRNIKRIRNHIDDIELDKNMILSPKQ